MKNVEPEGGPDVLAGEVPPPVVHNTIGVRCGYHPERSLGRIMDGRRWTTTDDDDDERRRTDDGFGFGRPWKMGTPGKLGR